MSPLGLVSLLVVSSSVAIVLYLVLVGALMGERGRPAGVVLLLAAPLTAWRLGARALPIAFALASLLYLGAAFTVWGPQ